MEEQRDAFVVVIEHEGEGLDRHTAATIKRALEDTTHRVVQSRLRGEVTVSVKPLTTDEHEGKERQR